MSINLFKRKPATDTPTREEVCAWALEPDNRPGNCSCVKGLFPGQWRTDLECPHHAPDHQEEDA